MMNIAKEVTHMVDLMCKAESDAFAVGYLKATYAALLHRLAEGNKEAFAREMLQIQENIQTFTSKIEAKNQ